MKAVITVTGRDSKGIVAAVAKECTDFGTNIVDISQTVMQEYFAMIILVELSGMTQPFPVFVDSMEAMGRENGLEIRVMHEDIFNSMHRI